jgi:site-specific recombinase XerD
MVGTSGAPLDGIDGDLPALVRSFERHLRAANRSPRTIEKYVLAATQLVRFLHADGLSVDAAAVRKRDVEAYIAFLLERFKPGTALTHYQDLQVFFRWLESEGEVDTSPMARMTPPMLPDVPGLLDERLRLQPRVERRLAQLSTMRSERMISFSIRNPTVLNTCPTTSAAW